MILIPDSVLGTMGWQGVSSVARFSQGVTVLIGFVQQNAKGKTIMKTIKRTSILRSCKFDWPEELKPDYAINPYVGCAHNCSYCWARDMTYRFRKQWKIPDDFEWDKPLIVENALELLDKELKTKKPGRVLLSSMTDPYQPWEYKLGLTRKLLGWLLKDKNWEVIILTKNALNMRRDRELFEEFEDRIWVGATITDASLGSEISGNTLASLHDDYYISTFCSFEPWPPDTYGWAIISSWQEVVDYWIIGSLNKGGRAVDPFFYKRQLPPLIEWMDKEGIRYYIKKELRRAVGMEER